MISVPAALLEQSIENFVRLSSRVCCNDVALAKARRWTEYQPEPRHARQRPREDPRIVDAKGLGEFVTQSD
jgi:hypothetical protein